MGVGVGVLDIVGTGVAVVVGVLVCVAVGIDVAVGLAVGVLVAVGVAVALGVDVAVGVDVGISVGVTVTVPLKSTSKTSDIPFLSLSSVSFNAIFFAVAVKSVSSNALDRSFDPPWIPIL
jgi:hypothetical protein